MTTDNEPRISVAPPEPDRPDDRTLTLTFAPDAPLAMIRVEIDPALAGASDRTYVAFLDQALARLRQHRNDYAAAAAADLLLTPPTRRRQAPTKRGVGGSRPRTTSCAHHRHTAC